MSEIKIEEATQGSEKPPQEKTADPAETTWQYEWMLRTCDMYHSEYKICKSLRGKFNSLFVNGEIADCSQWQIDYNNCAKWKKSSDEEAYADLLASEKVRRLQRLRPHYANNVWEKRTEPPPDWNAPLPDWLQERERKTFLAGKQFEIESTGDKEYELRIPSACTIL